MALPQFTIRELLDAGVHFGHQTHRWNPKMASYIYGSRNGIHIIDLQQTVPAMFRAMGFLRNTVASGGRVLFVGSKRQAQEIMSEAAQRCGQYYVNHRWLGGMLTNWKTISVSIKRLKHLEDVFANPEASKHTKMELLQLQREYVKLQRALGGIKNMGGLPDALFVVDTNKESIAIAEAKKLGIPVVAVVDSNCTPDNIDFIVPGNDDSTRALRLYGRLVSDAILDGISAQVAHASAKQGDGESSAPRRSGGRKTVVNLSAKASQAAKKTGTDEAEVAEVVAPEASEPVKAAATRG